MITEINKMSLHTFSQIKIYSFKFIFVFVEISFALLLHFTILSSFSFLLKFHLHYRSRFINNRFAAFTIQIRKFANK